MHTTTHLNADLAAAFCRDLTQLCRRYGVALLAPDAEMVIAPEATEGRMTYALEQQCFDGTFTTFPTLAGD